MKRTFFVIGVMVMGVMEGSLAAQTFTTIHNFSKGISGSFTFTNADGGIPYAGLVLSSNTLYGVASGNGAQGQGTVFSVDTGGSNFTVLHTFTTNVTANTTDGESPYGKMALAGTTLYGTTSAGGTNNGGVIFSVNTNGNNFSVLHLFNTDSDGSEPQGGLVIAGNLLLGTTPSGGTNGYGTIFSINTNGSNFKVIHSFSNSPDGALPFSGLVLSSNILYGMAYGGGAKGLGTVFAMNTNGANFKVLHSFTNNPDGAYPFADLLVSGTMLYGTTTRGGTNGTGTVFAINTNGTGFTLLHNFAASQLNDSSTSTNSDGIAPEGSLTMSGNTLCGTTISGGLIGNGTFFSVSTNGGSFAVLHTFSVTSFYDKIANQFPTNADGANPYGDLVSSGSTIYGTAANAGAGSSGTVFSLQLPPVIITAIAQNLDGSVTINFLGEAFNTYLVQAATNLAPMVNWQPISTNTAGTDGTWQTKDTNTSHFPVRFYRAATP